MSLVIGLYGAARARPGERKWLCAQGGGDVFVGALAFFWRFYMARNGWCTAHCSLDALPLCFPSASPLLVIVSLAPHRPASPVTIDIRDSSGIGLRSLKFDSCLRSMLQRICIGYKLRFMSQILNASGEHLVILESIWYTCTPLTYGF